MVLDGFCLQMSVLFLLVLPALSAATLHDGSRKSVPILELAPRDRTPDNNSNTTMPIARVPRSSRMSRQKRQTEPSILFDGSPSLKWVQWSGSLPDGSVSIWNDYENRVDVVCKYGCHAGFYNSGKGSYCQYPYYNKEHKVSNFDILVNKDNFEMLEWKDDSWGSVPEHSVKTCSGVDIYVAKNKFGLGKVHVRNKAFFLPWEGSEYFYKTYQVLTYRKDVISEHISEISYDVGVNVIKYPPESLFTTTVTNNECSSVVKSPTVSVTRQTQTRFDFSSSTKFGFSTSFTGGIPIIASTTISISSEKTSTFSRGNTRTDTTTQSMPLSVTVPPNHYCRVQTVVHRYKANIPFTARLTRRFTNGEVTSTFITGTYTGVDAGEASAVVERCRPVPKAEPCPERRL